MPFKIIHDLSCHPIFVILVEVLVVVMAVVVEVVVVVR